MEDQELASVIIGRLNKLIVDDGVRDFVGRMVKQRVAVSEPVLDHPTIQCDGQTDTAGMLGLLNGIVGARSNRWGYIAAVFSGTPERLERFELLGD